MWETRSERVWFVFSPSSSCTQRLRLWLYGFCGCNPGDLSPPSPDRDHPGQLSHRRLRFLQHLSALVCIKFIPRANLDTFWTYCMLPHLIHSNLTWTIFTSWLLSAALFMSICNVTVVFHVFRSSTMGKGCITVSKYFLFLFNLIFFVSILATVAIHVNVP